MATAKNTLKALALALCVLLLAATLSACGSDRKWRNYDPFPRAKESNFTEKYNLTVEIFWEGEEPEIRVSHAQAYTDLVLEMSVRMQPFCPCSTTVKKFIERESVLQEEGAFFVRLFVSESELWFYDANFQPAIWVSIKIGNEKQTFYFARVFEEEE